MISGKLFSKPLLIYGILEAQYKEQPLNPLKTNVLALSEKTRPNIFSISLCHVSFIAIFYIYFLRIIQYHIDDKCLINDWQY